MPINVLKKDTPRGKGPPPIESTGQKTGKAEDRVTETELAAKEMEAMWESQEEGLTRWSESDGKRYSD